MPLQALKAPVLTILIGVGCMIQSAESASAGEDSKAYFAGGCFWCVEKDFESVSGVGDVISGYTGGTTADPDYRQVTSGDTGHYEAVEINYDSNAISYDRLLYLFFRSVDPTDAGGQFCDRGDSYRTAIFVSNETERLAAEKAKAEAEAELGQPIVTPILAASEFYAAEEYHQNYYKSTELALTRRGVKTRAKAYKFYRAACGRDEAVKQLWGSSAPFAG